MGSGVSALGGNSNITQIAMMGAGALTSTLSGGNWRDGMITGLNIGMLNHGWTTLNGQNVYELDEVVITGDISKFYKAKGIQYMILTRFAEKNNSTIGRYEAYANNNTQSGYILEPGGPETTASGLNRRIPTGIYDLDYTYSNRFRRDLYLVTNDVVPNWRGIRIHTGNKYTNTQGCLLPGKHYMIVDNEYYVVSSTIAHDKLLELFHCDRSKLIIRDSIQ